MSCQKAKRRAVGGGKHEFVWDGRGERGEDARYSIMPGRAASDLSLRCVHFRILAHLGRFNQKKGWCRLNQSELAAMFGVRRQATNKSINELVKWRYIEKRDQTESGESFCLYRVTIDVVEYPKNKGGGVSATADTPPGDECPGKQTPVFAPSGHPCPLQADTPLDSGITTRAKIDHIDRVEREPPSLKEKGSPKTEVKACLPHTWSLPADWLQWTQNNFIATEADIGKSAAVFHEHHRGLVTALTPTQWIGAWRKWCKREKLFTARCVQHVMPTLPTKTEGAPARIEPRVELTALHQWRRGVGRWDPRIGTEPKNEAEALARIAVLEETISKDFRSSPAISASRSTTTERRLAPCG